MQPRLKIGVLYSRVRMEEKWIFGAMEKRSIDYDRLDDRAIHFDFNDPAPWQEYDAVLERSISYNSGLYALRLLNAFGVPTVNTASVAEICGDKLMTSAALARDGVPQPHRGHRFQIRFPRILPVPARSPATWKSDTSLLPVHSTDLPAGRLRGRDATDLSRGCKWI